jgi:hypothetical protein
MAMSDPPAPVRHVLHVGFPKTGSKFLQTWFAAHPEIGFSPWGFGGFADTHQLVTEAARGVPEPLVRVTSHEALLAPFPDLANLGAGAGPLLPTRQAQKQACRLVAGLFAAARIVIVTRGFGTLLPSLYAEMVLGGATFSFDDFCAALYRQAERGEDMLQLPEAIADYEARFGVSNVLALPYELLRDQPEAFLRALSEFLGVEAFASTSAIVHPSPPAVLLPAYRRLTGIVQALPTPARAREALTRRYISAMRIGKLERLAALLVRRGGASPEPVVPEPLVRLLKQRCAPLSARPAFRRFEQDYFA